MIVTGTISGLSQIGTFTVLAFDIDFRNRQLLGRQVLEPQEQRYRIEYGRRAFRRAEKRDADLMVQVVDGRGRVVAASAIHYNAPEEVRIDLEIRAPEPQTPPKTNEYDDLIDDLAPLVGAAAPRGFSRTERHFLAQECRRRVSRFSDLDLVEIENRIVALWQADTWADATGLDRVAFYGWRRTDTGDSLDEILDRPESDLAAALRRAVAGRIIPDILADIPALLAELAGLRLQRGVDQRVEARVQLLQDDSGAPLASRQIRWQVERSGRVETGLTDGRGAFTVGLIFASGGAPEPRTLHVTLVDDTGAEVAGVASVPADPPPVIVLRLALPSAPAETLNLADLVGAEADTLAASGIVTVADLLAAGPDRPDGADRALAAAKLTLVDPDLPLAAREAMLADGLTGPSAIARLSKNLFLTRYAAQIGSPAQAMAFYTAAFETAQAVGHQIGGARLKLETTPGDEDPPDIPEDVTGTLAGLSGCGCEECLSAVSPAAYLAQLIDWVLIHLRADGQEVTLAQLVDDLHQPFDELPGSCRAVEDEVRYVRLVVELLWRHLGLMSTEDLDMSSGLRLAYRTLRNRLYHQILANLGADHDRLRVAVTGGEAQDSALVPETRARLASILGISEDRLDELWFDTDQPPVSPDEATLQRLFGYRDTRGDRFDTVLRPDLTTWRRARLQEIWQDQDWGADAYFGPQRLPFVDPGLIAPGFLRQPVAGQPVFDLLTARAADLADHRAAMQVAAPPGADFSRFDALLVAELGQDHGALAALQDDLQGSDAEAAAGARAAMEGLGLDPGALALLVAFGAGLEAGTPPGDTPDAVSEAWAQVYDSLGRVHRLGLRDAWVAEEETADLTLGARHFAPPVALPDLPSPWVATAAERQSWLAAFEARGRVPVIEPDLFPQYFIMTLHVAKPYGSASEADDADPGEGFTFADSLVLVEPPLEPYDLWQQRREFIDARLEALRQARQGAATRLAAIEAMLEDSQSGVSLALLDDLEAAEEAGEPLAAHLGRAALGAAPYRALARMIGEARAGVNIPADDLDEIAAILVQVEKRLLFADWRAEEAALGVTLNPVTFKLLSDPVDYADQVVSPWLHDTEAQSDWVRRLRARQAQLMALDTSLVQAVSLAEEDILPLLRNILIRHSAGSDGSLVAGAESLSDRLLADMANGGCQMTTRAAFAIQTLQALIRGIYNQEHPAPLDRLSLDTDSDYEAEWPVIGSYPTWRGQMMVYLYPESVLHVVPHPRQTSVFAELMATLPTRLEPDQACAVALIYGDYLADIQGLEIAASCQRQTRVSDGTACGGATSVLRSMVHVFGLAPGRGRVYWAHFESLPEDKDTISTWRKVPGLSDVIEVVGAVPHDTADGQRLIVIFALTRRRERTGLHIVHLDLDTLSWSREHGLGLPPGAQSGVTVRPVQKRYGGADEAFGIAGSAPPERLPTYVGLRNSAGSIYVRTLHEDGTRWGPGAWVPIAGPFATDQIAELCALVQRDARQYVMITRYENGRIYYRPFWTDAATGRDDGVWRHVLKGKFGGAFTWPGTPDIYVFVKQSEGTYYVRLDESGPLDPDGSKINTVYHFNLWLRAIAGVDLSQIKTEPSYLMGLTETEFATVAGDAVPVHTGGDLYKLLITQTLDIEIPDEYVQTPEGLLRSVQLIELDIFDSFMAGARANPYTHSRTGTWRLADAICRQMLGLGLETALRRVWDEEDEGEVRRRWREAGGERDFVDQASSDPWHIAPSGGDEESPPTPRKAIVMRTPDGGFRLKLRRQGAVLSTPKLHRIALNGSGPTDLTPLRRQDELTVRRGEIKAFYEANTGSPASVMIHLKEAYNHLPIRLGQALREAGNFEAALLWFRQVYDYLQPGGSRKIDHGLRREQSLPLDYDSAESYFDESENAHAIAETRQNSYTRQVLLLIIQCLLDQADAHFTRETSDGLARARELYLQALRLMDIGALRPGTSPCEAIIGSLDVDLGEGAPDLTQFKALLVEIEDPGALERAVTDLRAAASDTGVDPRQRLEQMRVIAREAARDVAPPVPVARLRAESVSRIETLETALLADPVQRRRVAGLGRRRAGAALDRVAAASAVPRDRVATLPLSALVAGETPPDQPATFEAVRIDRTVPQSLVSISQATADAPLSALSLAFNPSLGNGGFGPKTVSFGFCIPQNPLIDALRQRAEGNLAKLRSCRNIAGLERSLSPYDGPIGIGAGAVAADGSILAPVVDAPPTIYTYSQLIQRTKELLANASQMEAAYRSALESAETAALNEMSARHALDTARAQVALRDFGVEASTAAVALASEQQASTRLRSGEYDRRIAQGKSVYETEMLKAYIESANAQVAANIAGTAAAVAGISASIAEVHSIADLPSKPFQIGARVAQIAALGAESLANNITIEAESRARAAAVHFGYEQRRRDLMFQKSLAEQDLIIGARQIAAAQIGVSIARQERRIARLIQTQADDVVSYLERRAFNSGTYQWIAATLGAVYRFFLQEAESLARLAAHQLAFETASAPKGLIGSGYWDLPKYNTASAAAQDLGLTGSARLLEDVYRLDQAAFLGRKRKQRQAFTLDLARHFPLEFQGFRETGRMSFDTTLRLLEQTMPGSHLCTIEDVQVSVVGLVSPVNPIHGALWKSGVSRVLAGGPSYPEVTLRQLPERLSLTSAISSTSSVSVSDGSEGVQGIFQGSGFATQWSLEMPKQANSFDYRGLATVLVTIVYSSLHSVDLADRQGARGDGAVTFEKVVSLRRDRPNAYYVLRNSDLSQTPMQVDFATSREDLPPNLSDFALEAIVLYVVRRDGSVFEQQIENLTFRPDGAAGQSGGAAVTVDGRVSTRAGNGTAWLPMLGSRPHGTWTLTLPDEPQVRARFAEREIEDILLVLSIGARR